MGGIRDGRRRCRLVALAVAASLAAPTACGAVSEPDIDVPSTGDEDAMAPADDHPARLAARPQPRVRAEGARTGLRRYRLDPARESYLYVPAGARPAAFVMTLHGAGGNSRKAIGRLLGRADALGAILFAPQSAESTWDVIAGGYGPDVDYIDRALEDIFGRYAIDPDRTAVEGFSDGASYALSLGITNGDLFRSIIALSPGFVLPGPPRGRPRIFVAHGRADGVLAFRSTAESIVPRLREAGYDVTFMPHPDGHSPVPRLAEAIAWFRAPR